MRTKVQKTKFAFTGVIVLLAILITTLSLELRSQQFQIQAFINRKTTELHYRFGYFLDGGRGLSVLTKNNANKPTLPLDDTNTARAIPALVYHGIVDKSDRFSMTLITFKSQLDALHQAGWQTISIEDFALFMAGKKELPDRSFVLTFDDGRKDSFQKAEPLLRALGYQAIMFTPSTLYNNTSNNSYYMSTSDFEIMRKSPAWEIESHAIQEKGGVVPVSPIDKSNFLSNRAWLTDQERLETPEEYQTRVYTELHDSAETISKESGRSVIAFSYPFGDYGQQSENALDISEKTIRKTVSSIYQIAFRQIWPLDDDYSQNYPYDDALLAKRIEPSPVWSGTQLLGLLESGRAKPIPYKDAIGPLNGWKINWGTLSASNGYFETAAKPTTQGSFVFLDGTRAWKNYTYTAVLDWKAGTHVALVARYNVPAEYFSCVYSDNDIRIQATYDGTTRTYNEFKLAKPLPKENLTVGVRINDNAIDCLVDGGVTAHETLSVRRLLKGGIGIKTWDEKSGIADVVVKQIVVTQN